MHKFVEICRSLALQIGEGLGLDVSTRWSSTYNTLRGREMCHRVISIYFGVCPTDHIGLTILT
jgi:hypothetical protein